MHLLQSIQQSEKQESYDFIDEKKEVHTEVSWTWTCSIHTLISIEPEVRKNPSNGRTWCLKNDGKKTWWKVRQSMKNSPNPSGKKHSRIAHIFLKGQSNNQNNHISKMQDFNPPGALRQWPPAQLMGRGWHPDGAPCVSSYWTERRSTSKMKLNHIQETGTSMTSDNLMTA